MNTRTLTGWFLILGPIVTFVVVGVLWPSLIGGGDAGPDTVRDLMKNPQLSLIITSAGSIVFVATFIGLALLANSMNGGDKAGSAYAVVSGVIFVGLTAVGIAATGMNPATMEIAKTSPESAAIVDLVADGMFAGVSFYWGIGNILLGTAILIQKRLHVVIGWLFVVFGIVPILATVIHIDVPDVVGLVVWIALSLITAAAGVFVLRGK